MSVLKIDNAVNRLANDLAKIKEKSGSENNSFNEVLKETIGTLSQIQKDADEAVKELAKGGDLQKAVIAMEKADMAFNLMVEIRNRLISAYEEIQRMQV
jgi:flagellar hook-basal body complex protein FliE